MRAGVKLVRGMRDRLAATQHGLSHVVDTAARVATHAQYVQVATPIIETTALFTHAIGEGTDVVNKEMFSFVDGARGESVSLRPEGTAGVLRAALTAKEFRGSPLVQKFYYHGPMFRRERPQKGRYRQFEQFGVENLGCSHPHTDVEVISLGQQLLTELGLAEEAELQINSLCDAETRVRHHTLLTAFLQSHADQLSTTSQERLAAGHVLRILDSKDPGDGSVVESAPRLLDVATEAAQTRFAEVLAGLDVLGIPYTVNHRLVRGLDYYSSTVWEFTTSRLGAQVSQRRGRNPLHPHEVG
jgi:histidyl-tRNA synthetase